MSQIRLLSYLAFFDEKNRNSEEKHGFTTGLGEETISALPAFVAWQRGAGKKEKANEFFTLSLVTLAVVVLALWLIYGLGISELLRVMGANDTLFPYALTYMKYINLFLPVAVFSNFIAIFVRADGDPNRAMAGVLCGGAALASMIGMGIQVLVAGSHFFSAKNGLHLIHPKQVCLGVKKIISNGIPSFFNEFANGFIVLLFNVQILRYCGESALSVYSVISNCVILFNSLFTGVGQSIQPVVATNYGAGQWDRIGKAKNMAFLPMGINLLTSYYLQSVMCVKQSLTISLLRNIILSGIGILVFPLLLGGNSLWMVMPTVEIVVLLLSATFLKQHRQRR